MRIPVLAGALTAALLVAAPASATPDRTVEITAANPTDEFTSADATAVNLSQGYGGVDDRLPFSCTQDPTTMCDRTLVHVSLSDVQDAELTFRLEGFGPATDFDLRVYEAAPDGTHGEGHLDAEGDPSDPELPIPVVGDPRPSLNAAGTYETAIANLSGTEGLVDQYFVVEIPYFTVVNDHYTLKVALTSTTPYDPTAEEEL